MRILGFLICLLASSSATYQAVAQQAVSSAPALAQRPSPAEPAPVLVPRAGASRTVVFDVLTAAPAPRFELFDNGRPADSIRYAASPLPSQSGEQSQTVFVIDAVNSTVPEVVRSEDAIKAFLKQNGGALRNPASILVVEYGAKPGSSAQAANGDTTQVQARQLFVHRIPASTDGNALALALSSYKPSLQRTLEAQGGYADLDKSRLSLQALDFVASGEAAMPGVKLVIWLSPGWPALLPLSKQSRDTIFSSVVYFTQLLRGSRVLLYAVDPQGVTGQDAAAINEGFLLATRPGGFRATATPAVPAGPSSYASFLKAPRTAKEANPNDLALQVLAHQSGGLILGGNNDLLQLIEECAADSARLHSFAYTPPEGSGLDAYHEIQVKVAGTQEPGRTQAGFYGR